MGNRIFKWLVRHYKELICVVLFLLCVIAAYFSHLKVLMYKKIINTIKNENELISGSQNNHSNGIWNFARRDNLEFLLNNIQAKGLLQHKAITLSSIVIMQYIDNYSFCFCWVTVTPKVTSIKLSFDNEGDSVVIEIPDMVQKRHLEESKSFICHGYADVIEKNNKLYYFFKKLNDGELIYVDFFSGDKKIGEQAYKRVRIVNFAKKSDHQTSDPNIRP